VLTRHTVEVVSGSELDVDVEVDMDVDDGFRVTVFCIVSVTLDTATVVGFAVVDEGEGPLEPEGSTLPRDTYPYTPSPPQTSSGHAGQGVSHLESSTWDDLTGA
jgi:hypothetical protein